MIVLDNGDALRGIAEVASKLAYTIHGYVGTTGTQLAAGYISNGEGDLYLSGANDIKVTTITVVNTDSAARTFTLYFRPTGNGTSYAISPVSLDLGIGHSFYSDGQRMVVMDKGGQILSTWAVDDTPVDGETAQPISSNWAYDHKESAKHIDKLLTTKGDVVAYTTVPVRIGIGTNTHVLTADSGETAGLKWAAAAGKGIATGSYAGNDGDARQITTGFKCSLVIISTLTNLSWIIIPSSSNRHYTASAYHDGQTAWVYIHASDGFRVGDVNYAAHANATGTTYYYWAMEE